MHSRRNSHPTSPEGGGKNLEQWLKSPMSLLFFKNIRRLQLATARYSGGAGGLGLSPIAVDGPGWTRMMRFCLSDPKPCHSPRKLSPRSSRNGSRRGRRLRVPTLQDRDRDGAKGRLFVVLPTGVETELPFPCNAPLIQDPARLEDKDPTISPTNRWLLQRAGTGLPPECSTGWAIRAAC